MSHTNRILTATLAALLVGTSISACNDTTSLLAPRTGGPTATAMPRVDGGSIRSYPISVLADFRTVLMPSAIEMAPGAVYEWTFADGSHASGAEVSHVFSRKGNETVRLRITNPSGQISDVTRDVPISASIFELGTQLSGIVPGGLHTCAVNALSNLLCWGYNGDGNLGNGLTEDASIPLLISTSNDYSQIATGLAHSCGLSSDGSVRCWGRNRDGQLGDGTTTSHAKPSNVSGNVLFASISVGSAHSCGLDAKGIAYCWGSNESGQLGIGVDAGQSLAPAPVVGDKLFSVIRAGYDNTCAIEKASLDAYCWGMNDVGQIGDNSGGITGMETTNAPALVSGGLRFSQIDVGWGHVCGLTTDNRAYCWGWNYFGQLGAPVEANSCGKQPCSKVPLAEMMNHSFSAISVGETHTCALESDGAAYCWGNNDNGELGGSTLLQSTFAARVSDPVNQPGMGRYKSIQSGGAYTCAVGIDDLGYCWGSNIRGKLGLGDTEQRAIPTVIAGLTF